MLTVKEIGREADTIYQTVNNAESQHFRLALINQVPPIIYISKLRNLNYNGEQHYCMNCLTLFCFLVKIQLSDNLKSITVIDVKIVPYVKLKLMYINVVHFIIFFFLPHFIFVRNMCYIVFFIFTTMKTFGNQFKRSIDKY